MNFVDIIVIVILILSIFNGFRKGVINSIMAFISTLLIFVIAFYLKNPVSLLLYNNVPFFNLEGLFEGITAYNILIFEGISYLITISILSMILGVVAKVTGVVSKIINNTIVVGIPSRILGLLVGLLQGFILSFIIVFILSTLDATSVKVKESKYGNVMIQNTPILSHIVKDTYDSINKIMDITRTNSNTEEANYQALEVLLEHEIISPKSALKLVDKGKLNIAGAKELISKY